MISEQYPLIINFDMKQEFYLTSRWVLLPKYLFCQMYKIDELIDFTPLLNNELVHVCISLVSVILVLSNKSYVLTNITLQCKYKIWQNGSIILSGHGEKEVDKSKILVCLLGKYVESVDVIESDTLRLNFSDNYSLDLIDNSDMYESFVISGEIFGLIVWKWYKLIVVSQLMK